MRVFVYVANRTWTRMCQLIRIFCLNWIGAYFHSSFFHFFSLSLALFPILQTDQLKRDIRHKVLENDLEEFERPTFNQTALKMLLDNVRSLTDNTAQAVNSLEKIIYLIQNTRHDSLGHYLGVSLPSMMTVRVCIACFAVQWSIVINKITIEICLSSAGRIIRTDPLASDHRVSVVSVAAVLHFGDWCVSKLSLLIDLVQCGRTIRCDHLLATVRHLFGIDRGNWWFLHATDRSFLQ